MSDLHRLTGQSHHREVLAKRPANLRSAPSRDVTPLLSFTPLAHTHAHAVVYLILTLVSDMLHDAAFLCNQ